jgi:hypothetical protein
MGIFYKHSHFATDAFETCRCCQSHNIIGVAVQALILPREIDRLPSEQCRKTVSGDIDFNAIGIDYHAA